MTAAPQTVAMLTMLPSVPYTSTEGNELSMIGFGISRLLSCGMNIMGCCRGCRCDICHTAGIVSFRSGHHRLGH